MTIIDTTGDGYQDGTLACCARVVDLFGDPLVQSDVAEIAMTIYLLSSPGFSGGVRAAVADFSAVDVTVGDVLYDELQTGDPWTEDDDGYNFLHVIDVGSHAAFAAVGTYLVEYTFTPTSGQVIIVRFKVTIH